MASAILFSISTLSNFDIWPVYSWYLSTEKRREASSISMARPGGREMEEERASFSASLLTIFSLKDAVSIPLSLRSSMWSSSSFLPMPYNTAATCLHSTAQSGQEQENFISLTFGKRFREEDVKYSLKESGNLPLMKSSTDSKLFLHLSSKVFYFHPSKHQSLL